MATTDFPTRSIWAILSLLVHRIPFLLRFGSPYKLICLQTSCILFPGWVPFLDREVESFQLLVKPVIRRHFYRDLGTGLGMLSPLQVIAFTGFSKLQFKVQDVIPVHKSSDRPEGFPVTHLIFLQFSVALSGSSSYSLELFSSICSNPDSA